MSIIEYTWTPTSSSVYKKNTKYQLADAVISIWNKVQDCKDEETKRKIIETLLMVL